MSAPERAIKTACERTDVYFAHYQEGGYAPRVRRMIASLATYIAEHEEEPVDPLILEARELTAQYFDAIECGASAASHRAGIHDDHINDPNWEIGLTYAALKRGKEIGQEQSS